MRASSVSRLSTMFATSSGRNCSESSSWGKPNSSFRLTSSTRFSIFGCSSQAAVKRADSDFTRQQQLTDRGWALNGISIRDLFADNGLAPLGDDDMRMGDMLYVKGHLQ